jgi:hypothetical protein
VNQSDALNLALIATMLDREGFVQEADALDEAIWRFAQSNPNLGQQQEMPAQHSWLLSIQRDNQSWSAQMNQAVALLERQLPQGFEMLHTQARDRERDLLNRTTNVTTEWLSFMKHSLARKAGQRYVQNKRAQGDQRAEKEIMKEFAYSAEASAAYAAYQRFRKSKASPAQRSFQPPLTG